MEYPQLDTVASQLREGLEYGTIVGPASPPSTGNDTRVFDHHIFQVRRCDPDAMFGSKHSLHDLLIVLAVGEEAKRDGAGHSTKNR